MRRTMMVVAGGALAVMALVACYDPAVRSCAFTCAVDGDCPGGLSCSAGLCRRDGDSCGGDDAGDPDAPPITGDWAALAAGGYHACAITTEHALWCWGNNDYRQLGQVSPRQVATPVRVDASGAADWEHVAASARHTCAIRQDGTLWCWGLNDSAQCGTAPSSFVAPTQVADPPGLSGARWTAVAAGAFFTCALRDDGTLWCFGTSVEGQLGQGTVGETSAVPLKVGIGDDWRAIEAGTYHLCGIHGAPGARGQLACWGYDPAEGRIGNGMTGSRSEPTAVVDDGLIDWRRISVGEYAACALDAAGGVWCWGETYHVPGNVGSTQPRRYALAGSVDGLGVSAFGGCLVDGGVVRCWGHNGEGELGLPPSAGAVDAASPVDGLVGAAEVATGNHFACARSTDGVITCWGDGGDGQLGDGVVVDPRTPVEVLGQHHPWRAVDAGIDHTCAVTMAGTVHCWGLNSVGQLGSGGAMTALLYATPLPVAVAGTAAQVVVGEDHGCALDSGGLLTCWGNNDNGQRGVAAPSPYDPTQVDATPLGQVAAGLVSNCGVAQGARRCWGANDRTQLGTGVAGGADVTVPQSVVEASSNWTRVTMGAWFGCGLVGTTDPVLHCWGENDSGQTGRPVSGPVVSPQLIPDPTVGVTDSWLDVSAGMAHACALLSANGVSGTLYCWGFAGRGQLGSNRSDGPTLTTVPGASNWIQVAAGTVHTCGVRATGELHCWGSDDSGELGDGEIDQRASIGGTVGGFTDWVAVSAGEGLSCGIRGADRRLFCWGENRYGQVGNGVSVRWTPRAVARPE